ncbi:MAG: ABC transporter permease [Sandaracinus sp.]|nr:ABC transporter permease [Sandaracinus sp.]|tara:strand:- start:1316 stop:2806 length:1491 start_codon:yes stop_codon:yes gene_type:complete
MNELPLLFAAHARLALGALVVATGLGIPLGVLAHRRPRVGRVVLGLTGVIQTVPALALLAVMVPLLAALALPSIGALPAFLALVLYGLLPLVQNTLAGLEGVDPRVIRAADGVGMDPRQRLVRVELPLALPVLMAGLRTATVWTVGMATLSTPVGSPSLGNLIFAGLQTRRHDLVLMGCVGAAVLALTLDGLLRLAERGGRERRRALTLVPLAIIAGIGLASAAPLLRPATASPVRIGAKTFTEQYVLAAILEDLVEGADAEAEVVASLGSTVAFDALADGALDLYVDYSGTLWATVLERDLERANRERIRAELGPWLAENRHVELICELGFENTYALAMRGDESVGRIDRLATVAPTLAVGGDYELFQRPEWAALRSTYGLRFREERAMDPALMIQALAQGEVDVIGAYSTDGRLAARGLAVLEDPRQVIPPYDAVLLARRGFASERPLVVEALRTELCGQLDGDRMRALNALVDGDGRSPAEAAAAFAEPGPEN